MKKIFLMLFLFFPLTAQAAGLSLLTQDNPVNFEQNFQVDLVLDSEGQTINAVQGMVSFPSGDLFLKDVSFGDTIVVFWIEKPTIKNNIISFSGIIPGGYLGTDGKIFSLTFYPQNKNTLSPAVMIDLSDVEVMLNDGNGTVIPTKLKPLSVGFAGEKKFVSTTTETALDIFPPEPFDLKITQNQEVYDGQYFLVFDAQDKSSGLERYEISESKRAIYNRELNSWSPSKNNIWMIADSPYVLQDQTLNSFIFVRAIDKAGNVRLSYITPENPKMWYNYNYQVFFGAVVLIVIVFLYVKSKNKKKNS